MKEIPIKTTCNASGGEGVLASGNLHLCWLGRSPAQPLQCRLEKLLHEAVLLYRNMFIQRVNRSLIIRVGERGEAGLTRYFITSGR